ncbi:MAG: hypothetical protein ACHQPI_09020 [Thermoanaerobaculia bacterium]
MKKEDAGSGRPSNPTNGRLRSSEVWNGFFTLVIALATCAAGVTSYYQWTAIERANSLAEQSIKLAAETENPRLEIVSVESMTPPLKWGRMAPKVRLRNVGKTRAIDVRVYPRIDVRPDEAQNLDVWPRSSGPHVLNPGEIGEWTARSNFITLAILHSRHVEVDLLVRIYYRNVMGEGLSRWDCREWSSVDGTWGPCLWITNTQGVYLRGPGDTESGPASQK